MTVGQVLRHQNFLKDPHLVAHEVWEKSGYVDQYISLLIEWYIFTYLREVIL